MNYRDKAALILEGHSPREEQIYVLLEALVDFRAGVVQLDKGRVDDMPHLVRPVSR